MDSASFLALTKVTGEMFKLRHSQTGQNLLEKAVEVKNLTIVKEFFNYASCINIIELRDFLVQLKGKNTPPPILQEIKEAIQRKSAVCTDRPLSSETNKAIKEAMKL